MMMTTGVRQRSILVALVTRMRSCKNNLDKTKMECVINN